MGLIKNPDCGNNVNDQVPACIYCGRPMIPGNRDFRGQYI